MKNFTRIWSMIAVASAHGIAVGAHATQLTFNIYTNAAKTDRPINGALGFVVPQSYGDNVSDFEPTGQFESQYYYSYGTNGGTTPHVTVQYRRADFTSFLAGGRVWNTGYGDLQYALYPSPAIQEIRFTADFGYRLTLSNFQIASFTTATTGQTVKAVRDFGTANATVLWSAGPDGTVTVNGGAGVHDTYTPNVLVADGHTLSLIYGPSGNVAVDNVIFLESIPEPSAMMLIGFGAVLLRRRKNG